MLWIAGHQLWNHKLLSQISRFPVFCGHGESLWYENACCPRNLKVNQVRARNWPRTTVSGPFETIHPFIARIITVTFLAVYYWEWYHQLWEQWHTPVDNYSKSHHHTSHTMSCPKNSVNYYKVKSMAFQHCLITPKSSGLISVIEIKLHVY